MLVHDKQAAARQFLFDMKSGPNNLIHATSAQHARFTQHSTQFQHQTYPLSSHALSHHMPTAIEQLELYSAYAYQQQQQQQQHQQQQQALMIGSDTNAERTSRHQLGSEVLDLSRRDSVETTATSTTTTSATRKTPSPYNTNSSFNGESPAASPRENEPQQQQRQPSSPNYDIDLAALTPPTECQQSTLMPQNLLYTAQAHLSRLAPPLASFYPALYTSFGHLAKEGSAGTVNPTFNATPPPPPVSSMASLATAPPTQTSPNANKLTMASAVAAAAAAAAAVTSTAPNTMLHSIKMEDAEMTPLSPSSSYDGRCSRSPNRQQSLANNNPCTPSSGNASISNSNASTVNALKSTRPFKAFPRDPLVIAANFAATDVLLDNPRVERYTEYRKRVLEQIRNCNGGSRTVTNPKMRRMNSRRTSNTSSNAPDCGSSEGEERHLAVGADESSDCDSSYAGGDKVSSSAFGGEDNNNNQMKSNKLNGHSGHGRQVKDAAYYERRRKNNAAAKKSRDRRRIKEDEIAIRAAYLERQNIELLCQIDALKAQLAAFTSKVVSA